MMKMYGLSNVIKSHARANAPVQFLKPTEGGYDDVGEYVPGVPEIIEKLGAIVPLPARMVMSSGGSYDAKDRRLYLTEKLDEALSDAHVIHKGQKYKVMEETDYSDYDDVYIYLLKWVKPFDQQ